MIIQNSSRFILVFLLLFMLCYYCHAQEIKLNASVIASKLYSVKSGDIGFGVFEDQQFKIGSSLGISYENTFSEESKFSYEIGFDYLLIGSRQVRDLSKYNLNDPSDPLYNVKISKILHLHYLSLPVYLHYQISKHLGIFIGSRIGYLFANHVNTKVDGDFPGTIDNKARNLDSTFDYGFSAGLRVIISDKISAFAKFYNGFSNVETIDFSSSVGKLENRNRYYSLGIAYSL